MNITQDNTWILDSRLYNFAFDLMNELNPKKTLELQIENKLDSFIIESYEPFIDEYHQNCSQPNLNDKQQATQQLIAKEILYTQLREHLTATYSL